MGNGIGGAELRRLAAEFAVPTLADLFRIDQRVRRMPAKTGRTAATPDFAGEQLTCHLLGINWVPGDGRYDAINNDGTRFEIKYTTKLNASIKDGAWEHWETLIIALAPDRLPYGFFELPAATVEQVASRTSTFFHIRRLRQADERGLPFCYKPVQWPEEPDPYEDFAAILDARVMPPIPDVEVAVDEAADFIKERKRPSGHRWQSLE